MTLVILVGFSLRIPQIDVLEESARNLFLHVPMWFTMFVCFLTSFIYSVGYLNNADIKRDFKAESATQAGILFGLLGLLTGSVWARFTWGAWWTFAEPRMNLAALGLMLFVAYFILRQAFDDPVKRARISAVYNVFATTTVPFLFYVIPRQMNSLHPGAEGNPAFSEVTAVELRVIFYPAIIAFIGLAFWIIDILNRQKALQAHHQSLQS
jgi:heme exporter protein C